MKRWLFVPAVAVLPFLFALTPPPPTACPNLIPHEPLVIYDVSGGTIAGPIDIALTVYNDGTARISSAQSSFGPSKAEVEFIPVADARQFALDLSILGAGTLCDAPSLTADVPTTTLTILRGDTEGRTHTFSWLDGVGAYASIQQRVQTFIQTTFPNF